MNEERDRGTIHYNKPRDRTKKSRSLIETRCFKNIIEFLGNFDVT